MARPQSLERRTRGGRAGGPDPASAPPIAALLDRFRRQTPARAGSFIITVFGDAIAPRGGSVWLGSLIRLLESFGINDRQARTSVFRLSKDDWLEATPIGRRSFYRIAENGRRRFERATRRIYAAPEPEWNGGLVQLLLPRGPRDTGRDAVRRELSWLGFGTIAPHVMIHPHPDRDALSTVLAETDFTDRVSVLDCQAIDTDGTALAELVRSAWHLDTLADAYRKFLATFAPLADATRERAPLTDHERLIARLLLVHDYRKIILRDPRLPAPLLPPDWIGAEAYALCRTVYRTLRHGSERALDALETEDGTLPPADDALAQRFA